MNLTRISRRVRWLSVGIFFTTSFLLAWLVCLPLWTDARGLSSPGGALVLPVMMFTPSLATVLTVLLLDRGSWRSWLRHLGVWPVSMPRRTALVTAGAIIALPLTVAAGVATSAAFGFVRLDLAEFSGFAATLPRSVQGEVSIYTLVVVQLVMIPFAAIINGLLAFGEEIGWRGWLLPALQPLGNWPAVLLTGVAWGIWHTPLILLGYNFDRPDASGVLLMVAGCVAVGSLLGWLRIWSGSIWPCVFGHGAFNAAGGLIFLLSSADANPDLALAGPLGVGTWVVVLLLVAAALVARRVQNARSSVPVAAESRRT